MIINKLSRLPKHSIINRLNKNYPIVPIYYQQKRNVCFPLIMIGGAVSFFTLTQTWNPYFPRGELLFLQRLGIGVTIIGFILP